MLQWLFEIITKAYAILAVVPFLSLLVSWFVTYKMTKNKKRATGVAADITTVLLVGCVSSMYYHIFQSTFGFYLILFACLVGFGIIGNIQFRTKGTIDHMRALRVILRVGFLSLSAAYIVLLLVGIGKYVAAI